MKKTSIKTVIAACFVGMLILSNVVMLLINQSTIEKYFTNQIHDDMSVIIDQAAMRMEAELKSVERTVDELSRNTMLTDDKVSWKDKVAFFSKRSEDLGFINFFYTDTAVYDIVAAGFMVMNFGVVEVFANGKKNRNRNNPKQRTLHTAVIHNQRTGYRI